MAGVSPSSVPLRLHLKEGVRPPQAIETLKERIADARNLPGSVSRGA
jgi:hypothetical protein